jgi:hypothetical protein
MFFKEKSRDTCIRLDLQDQCAVDFNSMMELCLRCNRACQVDQRLHVNVSQVYDDTLTVVGW